MKIYNRRYIGGKRDLLEHIKDAVGEDVNSFVDLFAGTAVVADYFKGTIKEIYVNDFLYHNLILYKAFFQKSWFSKRKIEHYVHIFNNLKFKNNIFVKNYGEKWFSKLDASKIWQAREIIEQDLELNKINKREYYILISIIILATDKSSRSVGHFEAFLRSGKFKNLIFETLSISKSNTKFKIYNMDSNELVKKISADVFYIDPPYNSRQYAYFYHVLETISLFKMNKDTKVFGTSSKPEYIYEKKSSYSTVNAVHSFQKLINSISAKRIIVSYNNTDNPSSSSSKNKITFNQIKTILEAKGKLKIKEIPHKHFNSGKTNFINHKEFLFIVEVNND